MSALIEIFIYVLIDPITGDIRYVGKTTKPHQREKNHFSNMRKNSHKGNWVKKLRALGKRPIMEIVETVMAANDLDWKPRESHWIEYFKALGSPLTNLDSGGTPGQNTHCAETRRKISTSQIGKKLSPEHIEKMRQISLNRDPEINRRIGMTLRGRKPSAETLAKRSASLKGRTFSAESIAKMRAACKGRRPSQEIMAKALTACAEKREEVNAKQRARKLGKKASPETKRKMSASGKACWAARKSLTVSQAHADAAI